MPFFIPYQASLGSTLYDCRYTNLDAFDYYFPAYDVEGPLGINYTFSDVLTGLLSGYSLPVNAGNGLIHLPQLGGGTTGGYAIVDTSVTPWTYTPTAGASGQILSNAFGYNFASGYGDFGFIGANGSNQAIYWDISSKSWIINTNNNLPTQSTEQTVFYTANGIYVANGAANSSLYKLTGVLSCGIYTGVQVGNQWTLMSSGWAGISITSPSGGVSNDGRYILFTVNGTSGINQLYDTLNNTFVSTKATTNAIGSPIHCYGNIWAFINGSQIYWSDVINGVEWAGPQILSGSISHVTVPFNNRILNIPSSATDNIGGCNPYLFWAGNYS